MPQVLMAPWSSLAMATEVCFRFWGSPYIALSLLAMTSLSASIYCLFAFFYELSKSFALELIKLLISPSCSLSIFCPLAEKKWFTDEPDNAYPRNIQIKPMSTHMANQINQYKSTSSLIPPIREVEDEC